MKNTKLRAKWLIKQKPLPPVNAAARIANELLARLEEPDDGFSMPSARVAQLIGIDEFEFAAWHTIVFEHYSALIDLRTIWSVFRWATPMQLGCFDLSNVEPINAGENLPPLYDFLEVVRENGWRLPPLLLGLRPTQPSHLEEKMLRRYANWLT